MTIQLFNPDVAIWLVSDTWDTLRPCDIGRLLERIDTEHWPAIFDRLRNKRPDCAERMESEAGEILAERMPEYCADQPLDVPGYARRVAVLEYLAGLTRGDAQGVAEMELEGGAV
jgi:hypothetical protein